MTEPNPPERADPLQVTRDAMAAARAELRRRSVALAEAKAALAAAGRAADGRQGERATRLAKEAADEARDARADAAAQLRTERGRLRDRLNDRLALTPAAEVARLGAQYPIVLLPVRLETRFQGGELLLRVYPDDIFAEGHEPELTEAERAAGEAFWKAAWPDAEAERAAWRDLVAGAGAQRAAWIAEAMTPVNLAQRPTGQPALPAPALRESSWTHPAEAHLLPDRWIVVLRRGEAARTVTGSAIVEPLALTFSPDPDDPTWQPVGDGGPSVDDGVRWTLDFAAAEAVGMGIRIKLADAERGGFDRILVLGVKTSLAPEPSADGLARLLESHRFDRGVAIVPQGTPTNNTAAAPAPFPPTDPGAAASFVVERQGRAPVAGRDGARLMAALGLPADAAAHLAGADRREQEDAAAMARALWPVTLGYFLEQLMTPVFTSGAIEEARRFFVNHVRGRGPLPAFRVGNTPYGVLPVSSLAGWQPGRKAQGLERDLPAALNELRALWSEQVDGVPRLGRTDDADGDLLAMLGMDASTREVRIRPVLGEDTQWNLFGLFGWASEWERWLDAGQQLADAVLERLGYPVWRPRIMRFNFGNTAWPFRFGLVTEGEPSEQAALAPNYIDWIRTANVPALWREQFPAGWERPVSLLYRMLRHAALLEYHDAAFEILKRNNRATAADRRESELTGVPGAEARMTVADRLDAVVPAAAGSAPLHQFLSDARNAGAVRLLGPNQPVAGLRDALSVLAPLPTAELERLFTETLDVAAHRLDTWITAVAGARLEQMRAAVPAGCHLGAFGWVENLRPRAAPAPVPLSDGTDANRQAGNGGFIHAPSLTHAAAAAVLRNAYLSRSGPERQQYAIDLSSARVRRARFVLDAVRAGQPLGAVLGYRVERGLHDRRQDVVIAPLRARYPLVARKRNDPVDQNEPAEQIAARNVVDGLALRKAFADGTIPWGQQGIPNAGPPFEALQAELHALDDMVDSVSDLLLGESVYQIVKGSPTVAAATLDAMAQGTVRPPDPEIATQPRRGTPLTHKVAVVLGGVAGAPVAGWLAVPTPRAALEPLVDAWLGGLFGDPAAVTCTVELGPAAAPIGVRPVSLAELGVRPIDLLALSRAAAQTDPAATQAAASELDRRVQDVACTKAGVVDLVPARIRYEPPAAGFDPLTDRGFPDILALARAVAEVLRHSRALTPADLVAEDRDAEAKAADRMPDDAIGRADAARQLLAQRLAALVPPLTGAIAAAANAAFNLDPLRAALRDLSLAAVPSAYPVSGQGQTLELRTALIAQAKSTRTDVEDRLAKAKAVLDDAALPAHAADADYRLTAAREAVRLLHGGETLFFPRFRPAAAAELDNAIGHAGTAAFISADAARRAAEVRRFETVAARVRPALDAWRRLELQSGVLGVARMPRAVAQLPYDAAARWVALPFADEAHRPAPGRTSVLLLRPATPPATDPWAGLLLDQWAELIPHKVEQTGVAFHYDDPGAEAPQTILLAVPPKQAESWDLASLVATLDETLDLAKIRAVDGELLGAVSQLLPAIYLADSTDEVTVTTPFIGALGMEVMVMARQEG